MRSAPSIVAVLLLISGAWLIPDSAAAQPADPHQSRVFELPTTIEAGEAKEVAVLIDDSHLKLATVTLRGGAVLPAHSTSVPATVQVLAGVGVMHVAGEAVPVAAGTVVYLAAGAEHDVVPAPDSDMSLLVHYLRAAASASGHSEPEH